MARQAILNNYSIVSFTKEDDCISLVPSKWLCDMKTKCRWPTKSVRNAIIKRKVPSDDWEKVAIELLEEGIEDYTTGRRHELRAEEHKTLQTTDSETPKGRFRKRSLIPRRQSSSTKDNITKPPSSDGDLSSSEESDSSTHNLTQSEGDRELLKRLDALADRTSSTTPQPTTSKEPVEPSVPSAVVTEGYFISQTEITSITDKILNLEKRQEGLEKTVVKALAEIKSELRELKSQNNESSSNFIAPHAPFDFPLKTIDELTSFEAWLEIDTNHQQMVLYASGFGGDNTGKIVRTILSRLLTPALAKLINFIGANNKIEFRKLHTLNVVIDATRNNRGKEHVTESEIKNVVKTWFQNSRDLDGGRTARKTGKHLADRD